MAAEWWLMACKSVQTTSCWSTIRGFNVVRIGWCISKSIINLQLMTQTPLVSAISASKWLKKMILLRNNKFANVLVYMGAQKIMPWIFWANCWPKRAVTELARVGHRHGSGLIVASRWCNSSDDNWAIKSSFLMEFFHDVVPNQWPITSGYPYHGLLQMYFPILTIRIGGWGWLGSLTRNELCWYGHVVHR